MALADQILRRLPGEDFEKLGMPQDREEYYKLLDQPLKAAFWLRTEISKEMQDNPDK